MTEIAFDELFFLHGSILILTLLLMKIAKLSLSKSIGLYFVMAALNVTIHELIAPGEYLLSTIITGILGFVITIVLVGFVGTGINNLNYSSIMSFIGLVPWYLGWKESILIFLVTLIVLAIYALILQTWAFKSVDHPRYISIAMAKKKMTEEEFELFSKRSNVIFTIPIIVGFSLSLFLMGA